MRHFGKSVSVAHTLLPKNQTATLAGDTVDMKGYESALVVLSVGTVGTTSDQQILSGAVKITPTVQESDTTVDGDFTDVAAGDLEGTNLPVIDATTKTGKSYAVGYTGQKRYIRVKWTIAGSFTTGVVGSAVIVRANPRQVPTTQGT